MTHADPSLPPLSRRPISISHGGAAEGINPQAATAPPSFDFLTDPDVAIDLGRRLVALLINLAKLGALIRQTMDQFAVVGRDVAAIYRHHRKLCDAIILMFAMLGLWNYIQSQLGGQPNIELPQTQLPAPQQQTPPVTTPPRLDPAPAPAPAPAPNYPPAEPIQPAPAATVPPRPQTRLPQHPDENVTTLPKSPFPPIHTPTSPMLDGYTMQPAPAPRGHFIHRYQDFTGGPQCLTVQPGRVHIPPYVDIPDTYVDQGLPPPLPGHVRTGRFRNPPVIRRRGHFIRRQRYPRRRPLTGLPSPFPRPITTPLPYSSFR